jgi:hypothetical protein
MKDTTTKKVGPYHSTSRGWEKAMKRKTVKARRQAGKKEAAE